MTISLKKISIFIFGIILTFAVFIISKERINKRDAEISRIESKTYINNNCIQYALIVTQTGFYPCYNCPNGFIEMYPGEIWKYGKTCNTESGRYPGGLPCENLRFVPQFAGTESECLTMEKTKIYSYPILPESQKRNLILLRPPGNKIDR